ncbi:MAG: DUF3343 domain-containing protein [Bacillota bacterium]|jgi:hypothetical protein
MSSNKVSLIFTFNSSHYAIKLESACRKEKITGKLIPVPRALSSSCGTAFQAEVADREAIEEIARLYGIEIEQVVEFFSEQKKSILNKIFTR